MPNFYRKIGKTNPIQGPLLHKRRDDICTHKMWEESHLP